MMEHFRHDAREIVSGFRAILDDKAIAAIGDEGFDQLEMLAESGIMTCVLQKLEAVADRVEALGHDIRNNAEHFDNPGE